jgi:hypothetical protein
MAALVRGMDCVLTGSQAFAGFALRASCPSLSLDTKKKLRRRAHTLAMQRKQPFNASAKKSTPPPAPQRP